MTEKWEWQKMHYKDGSTWKYARRLVDSIGNVILDVDRHGFGILISPEDAVRIEQLPEIEEENERLRAENEKQSQILKKVHEVIWEK